MKKFLVILLVLVMALSGCTAIKNFLNSSMVDLICAPSVDQQQTAAQMLAALDVAQTVAAGFYPVAGVFKASAVLTAIRDGGCFLVAELKEAFAAVDAANAAMAKKAKVKATPLALPEYPTLRQFVK